MSPPKFEIFLIFPYFLRSDLFDLFKKLFLLALVLSVTC